MELSRKHGFMPFHVKKDSTGYIYNRYFAMLSLFTLHWNVDGLSIVQDLGGHKA